MFELQSRKTYVVKTGSDISTSKRPVWLSEVLEDDHFKRMLRITTGVAR